jgi:tRNA A37 threonylcarbamoyltransferase TsaD
MSSVKLWDKKIKVFFPNNNYSTDNAAMIGISAYYKILNKHELVRK